MYGDECVRVAGWVALNDVSSGDPSSAPFLPNSVDRMSSRICRVPRSDGLTKVLTTSQATLFVDELSISSRFVVCKVSSFFSLFSSFSAIHRSISSSSIRDEP